MDSSSAMTWLMRLRLFSSNPLVALMIAAFGSKALDLFTLAMVERTKWDGVTDTMIGRFRKASPISSVTWTDLRSEEHTSELQSPDHLVCRLLLEKKKHNHRM